MLMPYAPLQALNASNVDLLTVPRADMSLGLCRFSVVGSRVWIGYHTSCVNAIHFCAL